MTESTHGERVQESGVVGHSYDTDDRIGDLDIYEALVNPHEGGGAGQKKGGAGGPTMMPMGGAGAASGSSTGGSATAGTAGGNALKGTSAASAGTGGASGFSGTSGAGVGGISGTGFGGGAGLGTDALAGVGGSGGGLGGLNGLGSSLGSGGLSGSSWGSPSFGTGAAGLSDPTTNLPGTDPSSTTGGITLPVPTPTIPTIPTPTIPTNPGRSTSPITMPTTPSASGIKAPSAGGVGGGMPSGGGGGGGGGAGANTSDLGVKTVKASPEMLHKEAQHWDDTSKEFGANVTNPIGNQSPSSVDFGMMKDAFPSYNDLLTRLKQWSTEGGTEFSAISEALQSASGGYSDTEATNTATAAHTGSSRPE